MAKPAHLSANFSLTAKPANDTATLPPSLLGATFVLIMACLAVLLSRFWVGSPDNDANNDDDGEIEVTAELLAGGGGAA